MKVGELKAALEGFNNADDVYVCVNEPNGYWCPGGAVVGIKQCCKGFDFHEGAIMLVPENRLDVADVRKWAKGFCDDD